jgi:hypothetical protein
MDSRCIIVTPDIMRQLLTKDTKSEKKEADEEDLIRVHTVKSSSLLKFLLCEQSNKKLSQQASQNSNIDEEQQNTEYIGPKVLLPEIENSSQNQTETVTEIPKQAELIEQQPASANDEIKIDEIEAKPTIVPEVEILLSPKKDENNIIEQHTEVNQLPRESKIKTLKMFRSILKAKISHRHFLFLIAPILKKIVNKMLTQIESRASLGMIFFVSV